MTVGFSRTHPARLFLAGQRSPIGTVSWLHNGKGIVVAVSVDGNPWDGRFPRKADPLLADDLRRYFRGEDVSWRVKVGPLPGTEFQCEVWLRIAQIRYGHAVSYGDIARAIGRPDASRAVGQACGANPVPILIPCHRVLAGDRSIGGFSAGIEIKRRLLRLEGVISS